MKWKYIINGRELPKMYTILPIMVMMGNMPFLNKIVGIVGGQQDEDICHMCNLK